MAAKSTFVITFTVALLLTCAAFATSATRCPDCGSTQVPYPLSTGPSCGDRSYRIWCDATAGALYFNSLNNTYLISSISQPTQRFIIQPPRFLNNNNTCVTADVSSQGLQLDPTLPFNITSGNTIMYLNCSSSLLRSPLNCTSISLCHSYINNSAEASSCGRAPICCTFRTGGSSTMYSVRDSGCQAYRSFVNLDYSLPVSRWPTPGVEIQWVSPPEPLCSTQSDCDGSSTCVSSSSGGVRMCLCNTGLHWDVIAGACALDDTCDNRNDRNDSKQTTLIVGFSTSVTRCPDCGSTQVPYPLSTRPSCGDQSYKIRCDAAASALYFYSLNNTYLISSISQPTQRFIIRPPRFLNNNTCVTSDVSSQGLQLEPTLPFNITSDNTIMYLNCSSSLMRSPLNCTSTSLCHSYIYNSAEASSCGGAPICCTFRSGGSSTMYSIRVRDGGCQAYRSFVNLDYSLPVSRWPAPGVEIQ